MDTPDTTKTPDSRPERKCAGCGNSFIAGREWSTFCSSTCRTAFGNRMKARGGPLVPLVLAWTETRHAKPGTREAEICAYARRELTGIASIFNEEDEENGRSAVDYVETLMRSGTLYVDRRR